MDQAEAEITKIGTPGVPENPRAQSPELGGDVEEWDVDENGNPVRVN